MKGIDDKYKVFDMNHSGAFLAWTYMYGFINIPKCILYIEDRDLWTKALPYTEEISAYVNSLNCKFDGYDQLFNDDFLTTSAIPQGEAIVKANNVYITDEVDKAGVYFLEIDGRYYFAAHLNSEGRLISEIGNALLREYPLINFSMINVSDIKRKTTSISYRSANDRTDVSSMGESVQGKVRCGGHRNAAGCQMLGVLKTPHGTILNSKDVYLNLNSVESINFHDNKFICVCSSQCQVPLARYLLQERFPNETSTHQEGLSVTHHILNSPYEVYRGSIVWSMGKNITYLITCNSSFEDRKLILEFALKGSPIIVNDTCVTFASDFSPDQILDGILLRN